MNKMDYALRDKYPEGPCSKDETITNIHQHFCNNVFKCDDLSRDSILLVCGQWALVGRQFKKTQKTDLISVIKDEMLSLRKICDFAQQEDIKSLKEEAYAEQANILEKYSNIEKLEERYVNY